MYNDVIVLVKENKTVDEYGDQNITTTERQVFAAVKSIGQSEFYQAETVGLKPEIKFVIPDYLEYQDEKRIKYAGFGKNEEVYTVLRTYRANNQLEIVCKKGID